MTSLLPWVTAYCQAVWPCQQAELFSTEDDIHDRLWYQDWLDTGYGNNPGPDKKRGSYIRWHILQQFLCSTGFAASNAVKTIAQLQVTMKCTMCCWDNHTSYKSDADTPALSKARMACTALFATAACSMLRPCTTSSYTSLTRKGCVQNFWITSALTRHDIAWHDTLFKYAAQSGWQW